MEDQKLYIRTANDVVKVLAIETQYNHIADRTELLYKVLPNVWITEHDTDFEIDTNIHNLIDACIYEREYNGEIERSSTILIK